MLIVLIALVLMVMISVDAPLHEAVRQWMAASPGLKTGFRTLTRLGSSAWILIISAGVGLVLSVSPWPYLPRQERRQRLWLYADANFVFFTVAASGVTASLIKNTIGRARPRHFDQLGAWHFDFAAFESGFASFPSGHSTTFGALCMAMALLAPRLWPCWLGFAVLGGFSRVAVGAHYLSDIVTGLCFGAGFVIVFAHYLARRGVMFEFTRSWMPRRRRFI